MTLSQDRLIELIEVIGSSSIDDPEYATVILRQCIQDWPWAIKTAAEQGIDENRAWEVYMITVAKAIEIE